MTRASLTAALLALLVSLVGACGPSTPPVVEPAPPAPEPEPEPEPAVQAPPTKQAPPASAEARDIRFPPIARTELDNGLELNTVEWHQLPVVYLRLIVRSGGETDPEELQGLSDLVASMLKEGTRRRNSAQLAEDVEFLGADLWAASDEENVYLVMRALSEHLDQAVGLLADVAMNPAFRNGELDKLKQRERNRLSLEFGRPSFLVRRATYGALYGEHPYGRYDTTPDVVDRVRRSDLASWHRTHFVPNNAVLVAVGDVTGARVQAAAEQAFGRWRRRDVPETSYPPLPNRTERSVIVVDRPESVQSTIYISNLALSRAAEDYVPLAVANQVLGGSAASRLFMDLRERRSLTYGAYSTIEERVQVAPFRAMAEVRTEVTGEAMSAFYEHLERIVSEAPPADELDNAHRYLSDSFPLQIDTPGKIAALVGELRVYGLPDDYWDTFRTRIRQVDAQEALAAARAHIHPERSLVVIVGNASAIQEELRRYGPVTVVDTDGTVQAELPAQPGG